MKICFPVKDDMGLDSEVYGHFGSAPTFVVVNVESNTVSSIVNADANHTHGMCSPIKAIGGHGIDSVVVGGIGMGALGKLSMQRIKVFRAEARTVRENLALFKEDRLSMYSPSQTCAGHSHGGGCAHG